MNREQNLLVAEKYFIALAIKDANAVSELFHQDVVFKGPLSTGAGKDEVINASSFFMTIFSSLTLLAKFSNDESAVLIYQVNRHSAPAQRVAAYINLYEGLISSIEVIYDPRII